MVLINRRIASIITIVYFSFFLMGCSVFMAVKQPPKKNLNVLTKGYPRSAVIAELGAPVSSEERNGKIVDIFAFRQGYSKPVKAGRALFHGAADVFSLGLWEIIGTPTEMIIDGRDVKVEVLYDERNVVEKTTYLDGSKSSPVGHEETKVEERMEEEVHSVVPNTQSEISNSEVYYKTIYEIISRAIVKPLESGSGIINVDITLLSDGSIQDIKILDSSTENMALQKTVVRAIKKVAPFPPFPEVLKNESSKVFAITIEFK